jgi:hypothetical protein
MHYIEVKGQAAIGAVELSVNEWLKAEQLGADYWPYVVTEAVQSPSLWRIAYPSRRSCPKCATGWPRKVGIGWLNRRLTIERSKRHACYLHQP